MILQPNTVELLLTLPSLPRQLTVFPTLRLCNTNLVPRKVSLWLPGLETSLWTPPVLLRPFLNTPRCVRKTRGLTSLGRSLKVQDTYRTVPLALSRITQHLVTLASLLVLRQIDRLPTVTRLHRVRPPPNSLLRKQERLLKGTPTRLLHLTYFLDSSLGRKLDAWGRPSRWARNN